MKQYIVLFFLLICTLLVKASEVQVLIAKANRAYAAGAYTEAAETYKKVVALGLESGDLYYNMGNAYFKMNDYAHAILYYERAKRLDPGNEDIDFNLKVANNKIADQIEPLPELFYKRWYYGIVNLFPADTWARTGIFFFILSLFLGAVYLMSRVLILRKTGFWIGALLFLFSLFSLLFAWSGHSAIQKMPMKLS